MRGFYLGLFTGCGWLVTSLTIEACAILSGSFGQGLAFAKRDTGRDRDGNGSNNRHLQLSRRQGLTNQSIEAKFGLAADNFTSPAKTRNWPWWLWNLELMKMRRYSVHIMTNHAMCVRENRKQLPND